MKKNFSKVFFSPNKTGFQAARCHLQVIVSKPLSSCVFVSRFFFHQPQRHCCGSQALEIHSVCRVSYGIADNHRNTMCSLITVSVLQEIFRVARAPLSGIVLAELHWFPTGPIPLSKMCLMTFLFCPLRSDVHLLPCTHTHTAASSM